MTLLSSSSLYRISSYRYNSWLTVHATKQETPLTLRLVRTSPVRTFTCPCKMNSFLMSAKRRIQMKHAVSFITRNHSKDNGFALGGSPGACGAARRCRRFSTQALCSDSERQLIIKHALQPQTSVSLQALMRTGRGEFLTKTFAEQTLEQHAATELVLIQVAGFLRRELPIRLAHRIQDLEGAPVLRDMPSVKAVRDLYIKSFLELTSFDSKIQNSEQENAFARVIENIYERHSTVLIQMARGAYEFRNAVRQEKGREFELEEGTHDFLDRFYLCRIGIRVLIGQYLALRQPPVENYVGIICSRTSPYEIVKRAIGM